MIPYFLLIFVPIIFYFFNFNKSIDGKISINIQYDNDNNLSLPSFFLLLFLLLIFRSISVGRDLPAYKILFENDYTSSLKQVLYNWNECLFRLLNYVIGHITTNFHWYLAIVAVIEMFPLALLYCRDKRKSYIKIVIFLNMSTFILLFSGIRQSMAIAFGVLAFYELTKGKKFSFFIISAFGVLMHNSGFMLLLLYPLYYIRIHKKHLPYIIPLFFLIIIFEKRLFSFVTVLLAKYVDKKFATEIVFTNAYGSLILFLLFTIFSYVISDETVMDDESFALQNILLFALLLQCFAPIHPLAMRMNYYFIIFIPLAIGKALVDCKEKWYNWAHCGEIIMSVFFTFYFILGTMNSYKTGISALDTIPYIPLWK